MIRARAEAERNTSSVTESKMIRLIENFSPWNKGYAVSSMKNIIEKQGHRRFELTKAGRYLYRLRVENDYSVIMPLVSDITHYRLVREFLSGGVLVPVPPTKERVIQPVEQIALQVAGKLNLKVELKLFSGILQDTTAPVSEDEKNKSRKFDHIYIPSDETLSKYDKNQRFIIFDDYYDTGRTMTSIVTVLKELGFQNIDIFTVCITQRAKKRILSRTPYEVL